MNIELWKEDGSWIECPWDNFEDFERFIEDYEDIYIIDRWRDRNYSFIVVHWMDEDTAKYRQSLLPDTSAIHGIDYSKNEAFKNLDFGKLAKAIVEALKKERDWSLEKSPKLGESPLTEEKPRVEIEILKDNGHWSTTGWESFSECIKDKEIISSFKMLPNHRLLIVVLKYSNEIEIYRKVSRAI